MSRQEQLLGIKQRILNTLVPLVIDGQGDPIERADAALAIIELGNASPELYEKTLDVISRLDDADTKTDLLMRLLANVQSGLNGGELTDEPSAAQVEVPVLPEAEAQAQSAQSQEAHSQEG